MPQDTNNVLVSVIVVTYNSRDDIERCLRSVENNLPRDCEIILVDNASTDGTATFVAERFPHVRLVTLSSNLGFAGANNLAARLARGEYLVGLNPDTEVQQGWLQALLDPFIREEPCQYDGSESNPDRPVGITTPRIMMMSDPSRVNTCGNAMHQSGITVCRGLGLPGDDPAVVLECEVTAISGACFAIPRLLWQSLGGLDSDFFMYLEDTDLSLRARLAGYRCLYTPGAVVLHNYKGHFSHHKLYFLERNRLMMLAKCLRPSTVLALLPSLLIAELVAWGYALKSGPRHIGAKIRSYFWLANNRSLLRDKRVRAARNRLVEDVEVLAGLNPALDIEQLAGPALGRAAGLIFNPLFRCNLALALWVARRAGGREGGAREARNPTLAKSTQEHAYDAA